MLGTIIVADLFLSFIGHFIDKEVKTGGNSFTTLGQINALFENHELPNARDLFSKYIQYANLKQQKDALLNTLCLNQMKRWS